jgi:hypothetical protein
LFADAVVILSGTLSVSLLLAEDSLLDDDELDSEFEVSSPVPDPLLELLLREPLVSDDAEPESVEVVLPVSDSLLLLEEVKISLSFRRCNSNNIL